MISFEPSEEQAIVQGYARRLAERLRPLGRTADVARHIEAQTLDELWGLGLAPALIDGGAEPTAAGAVTAALVLEELGWADPAFAVALGAPLAFVRAVVEQGDAAQQAALLPAFAAGGYRAAAVAVEDEGLAGASRPVRAALEGGAWRLSGAKVMVPMAVACTAFLLVAETDAGRAAFIVPAETPGLKVEDEMETLGLAALRLGRVSFEDVMVPATARLGGASGCDVQRIIDIARVGAAAALVGVCRAVHEHSSAYTKDRVVHGAPLAQKQSVAFRLVDMFVEAEASRWMTWRAASQLDARSPEATRSAALARSYCAEQAGWITDEGIQLMGGHGFMRANPVELWYRNARTLALMDGLGGV